MSVDATRWAWMQSISPVKKLLLLSLADRANEKNVCWPSQPRLALDTGLDIRTIRSALNDLCEVGLINRQEISGRGYIYQLIGVENREELNNKQIQTLKKSDITPYINDTPGNNDTPGKNDTPDKNVLYPSQKRYPTPGKNVPPPLSKMYPESKKNLKENLKENLKVSKKAPTGKIVSYDALISNYTDNQDLRTALANFIVMRTRIKAPLTNYAFALILQDLDKLSTNNNIMKIAIVEQSIKLAWRDVLPLRNNNTGEPPQRIGPSINGNKNPDGSERHYGSGHLPKWALEATYER
ncbi:MAG: helix-turn-helix domain-containing protein [Deltaproteobacteria bacterium]|jgi:DNA-binding transcriptional regulator YhcF (GntR family)|nr:helix-turn-helix domain-containing protein [Deltaproteobacteria bacterium]